MQARISAWALAAALSAGLMTAAALPAIAGTVTTVAAPSAPAAYPGAEPGAMRTWVQLIWNPRSRQLERLNFTAWDPIPSQGLDLEWQSDDADAATGSGPITGVGTLSFRKPGAAAYDPSAIIAQYRGMLRDGRADGTGEFLDRSGFAYSGEWKGGLMDGSGRLTLPDGDEYVGAFRAGLRQGQGTYIDASGQIYEGRFAAGERDGDGIFEPATGSAFAATWTAGVEVPGTRHVLPDGAAPFPHIALADQSTADGLRLDVVAERRPHDAVSGVDPLSYTSRSDGETLDILPDDQHLLDVWHGTVPIVMTDDERATFGGSTTPSFLGPYERFVPVSLVFALDNESAAPISVVGGYVDVAGSVGDPEPAMQVRGNDQDPCSGVAFNPTFHVDNLGWSAARGAKLSFSAGSIDGRTEGTPLSLDLGDVTDSAVADLQSSFKSLGADIDFMSTNPFRCTDPNDERLCLGELRKTGRFGKLADFITLNYANVEVSAIGKLDYDWTAADGSVRHQSSDFNVSMGIASVANSAECGEGGDIVPVRRDPFELKLDQKAYRIAMPFSGDIAPGFTTRWRIELTAPQTSEHDFQIVLLLSDGRQVASRPIHLTYFMPPKANLPTD